MASSLLESTARSSLSSICRSCRSARPHVRSFTSSSALLVGPESPAYIDVPESIQPDHPRKGPVKGTLPVPREIFPSRRPDKATKAFRDAATPKPSSDKPKLDPSHPKYEYVEWKRKMAEQRRENLQKGLVELYQRKQDTGKAIAARSNRMQAQRQKLLDQGPRMDERLTTQSTPEFMLAKCPPYLPDPNREQRLARSRANVLAKENKRREQRRDALHTLYINARNFITTDEQLNEEIERAFPTGENPDWTNDEEAGENIWNLGAPPTVESLLRRTSNELEMWSVEQERIKKLAEEITGGTI